MRNYILLVFIFLVGIFASCEKPDPQYNIKITPSENKIQINKELQLSITDQQKVDVDSVQYFFLDQYLGSSSGNNPLKTTLEKPLGKNNLSAKIYKKGKSFSAEKEITLHTDKAPVVYTYDIVNTYPHDTRAFTQGLEFYKDTLYEGTGNYGGSSLRKVDLETGKVLKRINLGNEFFGEGISIMNDKIYQLTWQEEVGFIYDIHTFEKLDTFYYANSIEGWGLCNDGKVLYKSDGSNRIWKLDPETLEEIGYIEPVTDNSLATRVNELEWVEGKIYANTWMKEGVIIIDPESGAVEGIIDFRGLKEKQGNQRNPDVFNGIAYNPNTKKLYVTGKYWDTLFEVEIVPK